MIERRMIEKRYEELAVGDCVWVAGALIQVETVMPARGIIRYFYGTVRREGGSYNESEYASFSGIAHGAVLTELLPTSEVALGDDDANL